MALAYRAYEWRSGRSDKNALTSPSGDGALAFYRHAAGGLFRSYHRFFNVFTCR
ncbi:hypothetical protein LTSEINV_1980 [Salmonella enterica subsp. enterica serovar Inverness str. R8-3668]|uniref:Uncharacterized protein n=2 Tax=Salmonella enterica I TaxID=59201 RepID=G5NBS1_SALET|nr:hypothetical protein LTSEINV_1980 [Salmonella enterica subsp. enterica serovar Inverness str. R8-3668]EHD04360.1 hypothetical protein LTSEWAN_1830 [Salmonella enterica subsp. enterica serovar Wandsworth str. A4-580]EHJ82906.1 hypothetical protein LTSEBAI_2110 [Salmonella enterica subsp. enterica serovar Baildon str. R6-199]